MTDLERRDSPRGEISSAAEVLRLKLRLRELGAALRNQQESFNRMLEQLQEREEQAVQHAGERAARETAESAARRLRFLAEASAVLGSSLDVASTLASVTELAVPVVADFAAVDLVDDAGVLKQVSQHHRDARKLAIARAIQEEFPASPNAPSGGPHVLRTGQSETVFDLADAGLEAGARTAQHLELLRALEIRSYIAVPLVAQEEILGTLTVAFAESNRRYTRDDVSLIEDLGRRAATAIQNARLVRGLREAHIRLEEQTHELEAQTEELMGTTEELEAQSEELAKANEALLARTAEAEGARRTAEAANAAKAEFLATMSHELRTPLNAIAGYGELLSMGVHGPLNDAQQEAVSRIRRSQKRLLSLINDVLNFARLEAGQVKVNIRAVGVAQSVAELEAVMEPLLRAKGLDYRFESCEPGDRVLADPEKLEQVLLNLCTNAMKFTDPPGFVRLHCEGDGTRVRFHVTDTGSGIPPEKLEHIFEPFVQLNPERHGATEGVGLGLAISNDLAKAMGGELRAESTLGAGSTFTLELPRA